MPCLQKSVVWEDFELDPDALESDLDEYTG